MNELALFAGTGGQQLATQHMLCWKTVCYVEWDKYCVGVLKSRISDGYLDDAPIWDDCNTFDGKPWKGHVDVISAGFPCQPFSAAGKQLGEDDPRNGWPATIRIIREVGPRYVFLENVSGLLANRYFGTILGELAESGFDARWRLLSAAELGAPHRRDRLWIVAHANGWYGNGWTEPYDRWAGRTRISGKIGETGNVAYTDGPAGQGKGSTGKEMVRSRQKQRPRRCGSGQWGAWPAEPRLGRVVDGMASRLDRLKAIGNGQVPRVAAMAWQLLTEDGIS